jgi:hypothetical protein
LSNLAAAFSLFLGVVETTWIAPRMLQSGLLPERIAKPNEEEDLNPLHHLDEESSLC